MRLANFDDSEFDSACRALIDGYERNGGSWLEYEAYELISQILDEDEAAIYESRLASLNNRGRPPQTPNAFREALRVIFADGRIQLSAKDRGHKAERMLYAYRHWVPPEFLTGFLAEYGPRASGTPAERTAIVPKLRRWVVDRLADPEASIDHRLSYPPDINSEAERLSEAREGAAQDRAFWNAEARRWRHAD